MISIRDFGVESHAFAALVVSLGLFSACFAPPEDSKSDVSGLDESLPSECVESSENMLAHFSSETGSCYHFVYRWADWDGAEGLCKALFPDGHLVVINDSTEQDVALRIMTEAGTRFSDVYSAWIGFRSEDGSIWSWSRPGIPTDWTGWAANQPNGTPPVCAQLYEASVWRWHDEPCASAEAWILCEN